MASEKLQVILQLVTDSYKKEAREAATATSKIGDAAAGSTGGLGRLQGGLKLVAGGIAAIGVGRLVGEFRDMAMAAIEDAESQEILAGALRTNVGATDAQVEANERWISSMQIATRTADTDLRQAITDLTVSGRSLEDAQNDIAIATDIAASKGIELGAVIKALVRAQASGSTGGLARLGIDTKNAAGEMLSYDEVLKNAAKTMGGTAARAAGTLAGALERSKIAMEEAREEAGANFAPTLVTLTDAWNEFQIALLGGDNVLAGMQSIFNSLITNGINPFEDAIGSAQFVMVEFSRQFSEPIDLQTFETLIMMLGLTDEQVLQLRRSFLENGDAVVDNKDKLKAINGVLDAYVGVADPAVLATRRFQDAQGGAAGAIELTTDELRAQRDMLRELTDPVFAVQQAIGRLSDAQERAVDTARESGTASLEYDDALADTLKAVQDLAFAQEDLNDLGPESQQRFLELGAAAGIPLQVLQDFYDRYINIRDVLSDPLPNPFANWKATEGIGFPVVGSPTPTKAPTLTPIVGQFHSGGIVPGSPGSEQLILARAGETVVPYGQGMSQMSRSFTNAPIININNPTGVTQADLQYATVMASLVSIVEGF